MKETINQTRLSALINHPSLTPEEVNQLKAYKKKANKSDGTIVVTYNKRLDMGRRYADKSLSLQNFSKQIRHTLVHDTHIDIDIANCHPVVLSQYCRKNGIRCDILDDYVAHRDTKLQDIMDTCKISRNTAKEMVIVVMYLGLVSDFCIMNGVSISPPSWVDGLANEFNQIADSIKGKNEAIYKKVCVSKSKDHKKNKTSTTMSFINQIIEDDLIMHARQKLSDSGFVVETLCFDGLLILKRDIDEELLGTLTAYCEEKTGYVVQFEVKPMSLGLELIEQTTFDFDDYEHPAETLIHYDQKYCSTLIRGNEYEEYSLKKNYIEKFLCKVLQPEPQFVFQNGLDRRCDFWNPTACSNALAPIGSGLKNPMGGPEPFYNHWSRDVNHRIYKRYDFIPYNLVSSCPPDILNVFEGFNPEIYGEKVNLERRGKILTPYIDLVRELCGGVDEHAMYFHHFIAQMFQDPEHKPPVAIIFKGKQGTGKNMLLDALGNMINKTHYITSSNPEDFYGSHAEGYYRKIMVNLNEAEGKKTFDFEGMMKSMITEDTMTINPKNVRPSVVKNVARTIITTNKATPVSIDVRSKDRRYVAYQTTDVYLNKSAKFWSQLYGHFRKPEFMSALYQWFMEFKVENYNWIKNRPLTEAYKEMCNLYSPVEALFFEDMYLMKSWADPEDVDSTPVTDPSDKVVISISALYNKYEVFAKKHRFMKDSSGMASSRSFVSKLVELDFPIIRTRSNTEKTLTFVPREMLDHSISRNWLMGYENEQAEICDDGKETYEENYFD